MALAANLAFGDKDDGIPEVQVAITGEQADAAAAKAEPPKP